MAAQHDRVAAALELREPDRVPVLDLMIEFAAPNAILGRGPNLTHRLIADERAARFFSLPYVESSFNLVSNAPFVIDRDVESLARRGAAAAVKMGYDAAWLTCFPVLRFRGPRAMTDIFGRLCDVSVDEHGNLGNPIYREGLIKGPDEWRAWPKRDALRLPEKVNRVFREVQREYGGRVFIFGFANYGLFENVWQTMGFERFVVATRKNKEFLQRMIGFYTDLQCMLVEAMADAGLPGFVHTDDLAYRSGPMLSPRLIEGFFGDSYRRIAETARALGMKTLFHSCGDTTTLLSSIADWGFDAVHPLEPTAGVDLAAAKREVGKRICLVGNLDVTHLLVEGSREEIDGEVQRAISDAGQGGGYILAPEHSLANVSVERLRWMVEAAHRHGTYPLP